LRKHTKFLKVDGQISTAANCGSACDYGPGYLQSQAGSWDLLLDALDNSSITVDNSLENVFLIYVEEMK
jgi:hypothetical protein